MEKPYVMPYGISLAISLAKSAICAFGLAANIALIYASVRKQTLHGTCNCLIAMHAFTLCFFEAQSFLTPVFQMFPVTALPCLWAMALSRLLYCSSFCFMPAIAMDRFVAVVFPIRYKMRSKSYIVMVIIMSAILGLYINSFAYKNTLNSLPSQKPVDCAILTLLGEGVLHLSVAALFLESISLICYVSVWIYYKKYVATQKTANCKKSHQLLKSLLIIMVFEFCGWFIYMDTKLISQFVVFTSPASIYWQQFTNTMAYIASGSNAPILYIISEEYRKAFDEMKCFKWKRTMTKTVQLKHQIAVVKPADHRAIC